MRDTAKELAQAGLIKSAGGQRWMDGIGGISQVCIVIRKKIRPVKA
jgi:hypothetical protein